MRVKDAITRCPDCNGSGHYVERYHGPVGFPPVETLVECPSCDGSGRVLDPIPSRPFLTPEEREQEQDLPF